ncbi:MAG TPA: methyltransferase domain-containing protein [Candidatus Dormibacteraeota bacterium]|nr:methyltransferase domain-containing protein [Candidatus Dormibacteraeota bacterium]
MPPTRVADLPAWPIPFDARAELDWGDPVASRRLLREHLDQSHDGASRRLHVVDRHVSRLRTLLPPPPATVLDAACGPGLYAVRLARLGYDVAGIDVGAAVLRHARSLARPEAAEAPGRTTFTRADLRGGGLDAPALRGPFDACVLVYYVLEAFPRRTQTAILRRLGRRLRPGGRIVVEVRTQPDDHPPGRLSHWEDVPSSLLSDEPHLLLSDTTWDPRRRLYVLREVAVLPDGQVAVQQTTGAMSSLDDTCLMVARAGLQLVAVYDGWTRRRASNDSQELLAVAERPLEVSMPGRRAAPR